MSLIAITFWLLVQGLALALINLFMWRMLARWFGGEGRPNTFAFTMARLSILLTFNAWLTTAILATEARSVFWGYEMAPIHLFMTYGQGAAMFAAAIIISLLSPFIVLAAFGCGGVAMMAARGGKDSRSKWLGGVGMGLNGLLMLSGCALCIYRFTPAWPKRSKNPPPVVAEERLPERSERLRFPRWNDSESVDRFAARYEQRGYQRVVDSIVSIDEEISEPTIVFASSTTVRGEARSGLVVVSQVANLHADVHGDLEFFGQILSIDKNVTIHGDLHIHRATVVNLHGELKGELTGDYRNVTGLRDYN